MDGRLSPVTSLLRAPYGANKKAADMEEKSSRYGRKIKKQQIWRNEKAADMEDKKAADMVE